MPVLMTVEWLERFLAAEFPQVFHSASGLVIEAVWDGGCRVRQRFRDDFIRPGGTISGPTMMALADFGMYVALLGAIGPVPLAVTINLNINFLRKPPRCDLTAEATREVVVPGKTAHDAYVYDTRVLLNLFGARMNHAERSLGGPGCQCAQQERRTCQRARRLQALVDQAVQIPRNRFGSIV